MGLTYGVLGRLEVHREGNLLPVLPPQQRQVLCLLLARANTVVEDDVLFDAVWGRAPGGHRQRLFELVSRLRDALGASAGGGPVFRTGGGYRIEVAERDLDASRFEALRARGVRLAGARPAQAVAQFAAAEALWRGRAYLDVDDRPEFDDEIRRLDELRASCRELRLEALLALGRHQDVVDETAPLAVADALRERLQHVHLLALVRCGRKTEACRHYEWLWERLRSERLEPGPELTTLYERIVADDPDLAADTRRAPVPTPPPPLPAGVHIALEGPAFVGGDGRTAALDRIDEEQPPVVVIRGEPGAGKSRLAAELARRAHGRGAMVLWGRAAATPAVPYHAFLAALGPLVDVGPGENPRSVLDRLGLDAHRSPTRHDLFAAVAERLRVATKDTEVVLVVDDLQWIGDDGLALWRHLLRAALPGLTLVATVRRPPGAPEADWLDDQRRLDRACVVDLGGMGTGAVAELARSLGRHLPPAAVDALVARTGGNAFFVVTLLRGGPDVAGDLTGDVAAAVLSSFYRLRPGARLLLEAASLAGRAFDADVVARAVGLDEPGPVLDRIRGAGIVRPARGGTTTMEFRHDIVRDAIRGQLDEVRRRELHRRLGRVGEAGGDAMLGAAAELAEHFQQAASGDLDRVLHYSIRAGHEARAAFAHADAVGHYRRAVDTAALAHPDDRLRRCRLLVLLGEAQRSAYHTVAARPSLIEAANLALELGAPAELDRALTTLAWVHDFDPAGPEARDVASRALAVPDLPPACRARLLAARVLLGGPDDADTEAMVDEALELARSTPDDLCLGLVLVTAALARPGPHTLAWRRSLVDEVRSISSRMASTELTFHGSRLHAATLLERGDVRALDAYREFIERAAGSGWPAYEAGVAQAGNAIDLLQGRFAAVEARLPRLLDGVADSPAHTVVYLLQLTWLRRAQGRGAEILPAMRAVLADNPSPGLHVSVAAQELDAGRLDAGRAELARAVAGGLGSFPRDGRWMATMAELALAAWQADRPDLGRELYPRLAPFADQLVVLSLGFVCIGSAHRFAGLAALAAGEHQRGIEHLRAGLEVDERFDAGPALARGLLWLGQALSPATPGPGDAEEARRALQEAARRGDLLDMAGVREAAAAELARL